MLASLTIRMVLPSQQSADSEKIERYKQVDKIIYGSITPIKIQGCLELKEEIPLGFGSQDYINYLHDLNIITQQIIPLAVVNVWINDEPEKTNWTLCIPSSIEQLFAKKIGKYEDKLALLLQQNDNEDQQKWAIWENKKRRLFKRKQILFPRLIPIDSISTLESHIEFKNCLGLFDVTLEFREHKPLHMAQNNMSNSLGFFALISKKTTELLQEFRRTDDEDDTTELQNEIHGKMTLFLNNTPQELLDNEIIQPKKQNTLIEPIALIGVFQECIAYGEDTTFFPTDKVGAAIRKNILGKRQLSNPFMYIRERECKRQKLSHF